jgi:CHAD domain-containing protein
LTGQFASSWESQRSQYRQALGQCRRRPSEKNVHDLRIVTRRLFAHLELLRMAARPSALKRARRKLKQLMRTTSAARDAQVQVHLLDPLARKNRHPGLTRFRQHLKKRARRFASALAAALESHRPKLRRIDPRNFFPPQPAKADSRFLLAASRALKRAVTRVQARLRKARADPTTQHRLRVAVKKLRYLAEVVAPARRGAQATRIERLHAVQSAMGELHDFDLLLQRLEKFATQCKRTEAWLRPRRAALRRRRSALLRARPRLRVRLGELLPVSPPPRRRRSA